MENKKKTYQVWRDNHKEQYAIYMRTYQKENYDKYKAATLERKRKNYAIKTEFKRLCNILID